jgi:hypothetical protein
VEVRSIFSSSIATSYLYNPFSKEIMQRVISNVQVSRAIRIFVMYSDRECAAPWIRAAS